MKKLKNITISSNPTVINLKVIFSVLFFFSIVLDLVNNRFNIFYSIFVKSNLIKNDSYIYLIFNQINSSNLISNIIITVIVALMSVFFSVIFILIQMTRNRYPLDFMDEFIEKNLYENARQIIINLFVGIFLIFFKIDFQITKFIYVIHTVYCFKIFVNSYKEFHLFDPRKVINDIIGEIKDCLNAEKPDINAIYHRINKLGEYSEDAFAKGEISVAKEISHGLVDVMQIFIIKKNAIALASTDDIVKNLSESLFNGVSKHLKLAIYYNYENYAEELYKMIKQIFCDSVRCGDIALFEHLCECLAKFTYKMMVSNKGNVLRHVTILHGEITCHIIEKDLDKIWIDSSIKSFNSYIFIPVANIEQNIYQTFLVYYLKIIKISIQKCQEELYNNIFRELLRVIEMRFLDDDIISKNFGLSILTQVSNTLISSNNEKLMVTFIKDIATLASQDQSVSYSIVLRVYDFVKENDNEKKYSKIIDECKFELCKTAIHYNVDLAVILIPEYLNAIKENKNDKETIDKTIEQINELLYFSMINKNNTVTLSLIQITNSILSMYRKDEKDIHLAFVDIYKDKLIFAINLKSDEAFHIILSEFYKTIVKMDEAGSISEDLSVRIIKSLSQIAKGCITEGKQELCENICVRLKDLTEDVNQVTKKKDFNYLVLDNLLLIGIHAAERGVEEIVCCVSNYIGWIASDKNKAGNSDVFKRCIENATSLYTISKDLHASNRTLIFIGTLFVLLGTSMLSQKDEICMNYVLSAFNQIKDIDILEKSKRLRAYDYQNWGEAFECDYRTCSNKFFEKVRVKIGNKT